MIDSIIQLFDEGDRSRSGKIDCESFERYLNESLRMGKLAKVEQGITTTKYYIEIDPASMKYMICRGVARGFDAFFDVNNSRLYQDGKYVCLEIPNKENAVLTFRKGAEELARIRDKTALSLYFGECVDTNQLVVSLKESVHLLVSGQTGSGKSVFLHSLIISLMLQYTEKDLKMVLIDPKKVEFQFYKDLDVVEGVITDCQYAVKKLKSICEEMDSRYETLEKYGVRDIDSYNEKSKTKMRKIVVVIEEFADLYAQDENSAKYVERLVAKSRACGIHVIMSTQRPDSTFMTGKMKSNFRGRVAFAVSDSYNSRIILGKQGAEKLRGNGDGIAQVNSTIGVRFQSALITDDEIARVVNYLKEKKYDQI